MPSLFIYSAGDITITGALDGAPNTLGQSDQGAGSHLYDAGPPERSATIRIDPDAQLQEVKISDDGRGTYFEDNTNNPLDEDITIDGTTYDAGTFAEAEYRITLRDPMGNEYRAWAVEIENGTGPAYENVVGLTFYQGEVPPRGVDLTVVDNIDLFSEPGDNDTEFLYSAGVPCFTADVMIATPDGPRRAADITAGDMVTTRDNGAQRVLWAGASLVDLAAHAEPWRIAPIRFEAGSIAPGVPEEPITVSPQHRIMVAGASLELMFGHAEMLATARGLVNGSSVREVYPEAPFTYHHILLESPDLLMSSGAWSESFNPHVTFMEGGEPAIITELSARFPELFAPRADQTPTPLARPGLHGWETRALDALTQ